MAEQLKTTEESKDAIIMELNKKIAIVEAENEDIVEENIKLKESITTAIKPILKVWMDINN